MCPEKHSPAIAYFEALAPRYRERYSDKRPFLHWYFRQRMQMALNLAPPTRKKILDLGCGTGPLYRFLQEQGIKVDYYGADPAPAMLAHSTIPAERQIQAGIADTTQLQGPYDIIYLLGISTYLSTGDFQKALPALGRLLRENGRLVIHFTHRPSIEYRLRQFLRPVLRRFWPGKGIWTAPFTTTAYTLPEAAILAPNHLTKIESVYLPPTLPILHRIFPNLAIRFSNTLHHRLGASWRSDFLVSYQKTKLG